MSANQVIDERYPIGKFTYAKKIDFKEKRKTFISEIKSTPNNLRKAISGLSDKQLDTPYRDGGWTLRQVIHHLPDSHLNAFVRFKLALTENNPTVKTYDEKEWAELPDYSKTPVKVSLNLLENLHKRWDILLNSMNDEDFKKTYLHPEIGEVDLDWVTAQYAWHGKHHVGHIISLRKKMGW
jgi:DinB superfamily